MKPPTTTEIYMTKEYGGDEYRQITWHPEAVKRLGALITASIDYRGISMQAFSRLIDKSGNKFNSVWRLATANVKRPSKKIIQLVAPYVYRPKSYNGGIIEIDPRRTFSGPTGWLEMALWAVDTPLNPPKLLRTEENTLGEFLIDYTASRGLTQKEFEAIVMEKTGMEQSRLRAIMFADEPANDSDVFWLSHVVKDSCDQPYSWEFWQALKSGVAADEALSKLHRNHDHCEN